MPCRNSKMWSLAPISLRYLFRKKPRWFYRAFIRLGHLGLKLSPVTQYLCASRITRVRPKVQWHHDKHSKEPRKDPRVPVVVGFSMSPPSSLWKGATLKDWSRLTSGGPGQPTGQCLPGVLPCNGWANPSLSGSAWEVLVCWDGTPPAGTHQRRTPSPWKAPDKSLQLNEILLFASHPHLHTYYLHKKVILCLPWTHLPYFISMTLFGFFRIYRRTYENKSYLIPSAKITTFNIM